MRVTSWGTRTIAIAFATLMPAVLHAATINWNFSSGTGGPASLPSEFVSGGTVTVVNGTAAVVFNSTSASGSYAGASGGNNAGVPDNTRGALNLATSTYFTFSLTPDVANNITFTDFDFGSRSTNTGPQLLTLMASTNNFATSTTLGSVAVAVGNWDLRNPAFTSVSALAGETIAFRIYGSNSAGNFSSAVNWRIDDIALTYDAVPVPEPAAVGLACTASVALLRVRRRIRS